MDEQNRKIRMATAEKPPGQGHTIVGGRPAGARNTGAAIPRGLEAIMMKAAVDPAFLEDLLVRRSTLAQDLGFPLDPAEKAILDQVPAGQLREMAARTSVPEGQRGLLRGGSAAALIALVTQLTFAPVAGRAETPGGPQVAQGLPEAGGGSSETPGISLTGGARPESSGIEIEGGHRPDLPVNPGAKGGIRPDEPYKIMPPGGARPDIPDEERPRTQGIRPDLPPDLPPGPPSVPNHPPVATYPLTLDTLRNLVIRTNAAGLTFKEAVRALQNETGITITVEPGQSLDSSRQVSIPTAGLTLGKALRALCGDVAGPAALFEIQVEDSSLTIRFKPAPGGSSVGPDPVPHVQPARDPFQPQQLTRGSRPDVPPGRGD